MRKLRKSSEANQGSLKAFRCTCTCNCPCTCTCPVMTYYSTFYGPYDAKQVDIAEGVGMDKFDA